MARIVIAEDAPHTLRLLEMTLRKGGHQWTSVTDGAAAMSAVQAQSPDAVILDVMMPGVDGIQALAALKGNPETTSIAVILLTARGNTVTRRQAEESGATAFLTKPFSPTELLATLHRLTSKS